MFSTMAVFPPPSLSVSPILFLIDMPSVHTLHPPGTTHLLPSHLVFVLPHPLTSPSLHLLLPAIGWSGWSVTAPKLTWLIKPPC